MTNGIDGSGIYAVPALKDTATQNTWDVNGTLLAELGYDVDAVCAAGIDYYSDEFEEMLKRPRSTRLLRARPTSIPWLLSLLSLREW